MSEIPKRPDYFDAVFLAIGTGLMPEAKCLHYEHAVAKVAVEALRQAKFFAETCYPAPDDAMKALLRKVQQETVAPLIEALAKIEASGWTP